MRGVIASDTVARTRATKRPTLGWTPSEGIKDAEDTDDGGLAGVLATVETSVLERTVATL